ncbi:MAG: GMC family oxidoreductase [Myxococcales bacterium]|nr:GMC family oxidoreductase [Myxococcales bacterium]
MSGEAHHALIALDGADVRRRLTLASEVIVVGSGPAGATVARNLAAGGLDVLVLEEGAHVTPAQFPVSAVRAMGLMYRDMGTSIAMGSSPMPYLQGKVVGGTSVINGAISWAFPREIYDAWLAADPALAEGLSWEALTAAQAEIMSRLHVAPTPPAIAGAKNLVLARGAEALGVAHRPISRNVTGCMGSGRCLQGCPNGAKLSMERTFLPDAVRDGARLMAGIRVTRVLTDARGAYGVEGITAAGAAVEARARYAVVLAASAIQTPMILQASGITHGAVGHGLMAHPGVSLTARFDEPVDNFRGATQGHEVTGWLHEGLKLEAIGFDLPILASRLPDVGPAFARRLTELNRYAVAGAAIHAEARGSVRRGLAGRASVRYSLTNADVRKVRLGVRRLGEVMLAAGAREVYPGVAGFDAVVSDPRRMAQLTDEGSLNPKAYAMSMTHLFGTARMGSDPATSVVRPDFRHHTTPGLYIADSSVFPGNLGVNPQIAIMAMAAVMAASLAAATA